MLGVAVQVLVMKESHVAQCKPTELQGVRLKGSSQPSPDKGREDMCPHQVGGH